MWPLRTRPGWTPPIAPLVATGCVALIITICATYNPKLGVVLALLSVPMAVSLLLIKRGGR